MSGTTTIPNDPNPTLRAQLVASLATLQPQITGLQILAAVPGISGGLLADINAQISVRTATQNLIKAVLSQLDATVTALGALYDSGYPSMPPMTLSTTLYNELQADEANIQTALATFQAPPAQVTPAGQLTFSPNPNPPSAPGP